MGFNGDLSENPISSQLATINGKTTFRLYNPSKRPIFAVAMVLKNFLYVMLGGAVGAALRYAVGLLCNHFQTISFPFATLAVNVIGCFLLGLLVAAAGKNVSLSPEVYLMLTVGLCGAFTTFSTFSADTFRLFESGQFVSAVIYAGSTLVLGMLAFFLSRYIIR